MDIRVAHPLQKEWNINPVLRVMLLGTVSPDSPLYLLRLYARTLLKLIYTDYLVPHWKRNIDSLTTACVTVGIRLQFPEPTGININMMPFVMEDQSSLPPEYRKYWNIISHCVGLDATPAPDDGPKIGYLTIQESRTTPGKPQRRGGLHTESPGNLKGMCQVTSVLTGAARWGGGAYYREVYQGGLYMASTASDSCRVYNVLVENTSQMVGEGGDAEHLRQFVGKGTNMRAGDLVWLTDRTPHEALPCDTSTHRQFFRLVTSDVSVWHKMHSTANPLGIKPPASVRILEGNKFDDV